MLTPKQRSRCVLIGVSSWVISYGFVNTIPHVFDGGENSALVFVLTVPASFFMFKAICHHLRLDKSNSRECVSLMTTVTSLLGGLIFTFNATSRSFTFKSPYPVAWLLFSTGCMLLWPTLDL